MHRTSSGSRNCLYSYGSESRESVNVGDSVRMVPACTRMAVTMLFCILASLETGCSPGKERVTTREGLLAEYRSLCDSIVSLPSIPCRHLPDIVVRWSSLEDEMLSCILADSVHEDENMIAFSTVSVLGSRIRTKVDKSIDGTLLDFCEVAEAEYDIASRLFPPENTYIKEANDFYDGNLCQTVAYVSGSGLDQYDRFLQEAASSGIADFDDVKELLCQEDLLYRAYVDSMMSYSYGESYGIISRTEEFSGRLSGFAVSNPDSSERLLAYMTVRTIRRQMICARKGLDCILSGEVRSLEQATVAASGFTALLVHFNPLLLSCRTVDQNREVNDICRDIPGAFRILQEKGLTVVSRPDSLPDRIMKDYIDHVIYN